MTNRLIVVFFAAVWLCSCNSPKGPTDLAQQALIPKPVSVTAVKGSFEVVSGSSIYADGASAEVARLAQYLSDKLKPATGYALAVSSGIGDSTTGNH
ncbi:MAG: hypothetical protein ABI687_08740, partial [Flavitalea sp.]